MGAFGGKRCLCLANKVVIGVGCLVSVVAVIMLWNEPLIQELVTVSPLTIDAGAVEPNQEQEYVIRIDNRTSGRVRVHHMAWW
jgi:hypothetical protein